MPKKCKLFKETNYYVNFGWEYVYHCHILSHEEMDMMHAQVVGVAPEAPTDLKAERIGNGANRLVELNWTDNSKNETDFIVQRATSAAGPFTTIATVPSTQLGVVPYRSSDAGPATGKRTYTDPIGNTNQTFFYRVFASNRVGDNWDYSNPAFNEIPPGGGFPTLTLNSAFSNTATFGTVASPPAAPSNVNATAVRQGNNARVTLTWTDNANNETGFTIQRATDANFTANVVTAIVGANTTTYTTGNVARNTAFYFRIRATNAAGASDWVNASPFPITTP